MNSNVRFEHASPRLTAVIRGVASARDLSRVIPACCGEVWEYARTARLPRPGRHVAVYFDGAITLECGVEIMEPFDGDGRVICSSTPGGAVAAATHLGPYDQLGRAHEAVRQVCAERGRILAGPNWEIYGHWTDDPARLQTDVYYLLAG
jgi:effector-binding domain-containing protein